MLLSLLLATAVSGCRDGTGESTGAGSPASTAPQLRSGEQAAGESKVPARTIEPAEEQGDRAGSEGSLPMSKTRPSGDEASSATKAMEESETGYSPFALIDASDPAALEVPRQGTKAPLVVLIQFGSYQCEHTRRAEAQMQRLLASNPDVARYYLHNPLPGHQQGYLMALAASAAQRQGRFWEMHSALMEHGPEIDEDKLLAVARSVELDIPTFLKDLKRPEMKEHVERNRTVAGVLGVSGTPVFVVNSSVVLGIIDDDRLGQLVRERLEAARTLALKGLSVAEAQEEMAQALPTLKVVMQKGIQWGKTEEVGPLADEIDPRYAISLDNTLASMGLSEAPVTIVVFMDLACPFSRKAWLQTREILREHPEDVRFTFKLNPQLHSELSLRLARAAFLASLEGRFAQFADAVFAGERFPQEVDEGCAESGIDCSSDLPPPPGFDNYVKETKVEAVKMAAPGTPSIFINGRRIPGFVETPEMLAAVRSELELVDQLKEKGVQGGEIHQFLTRNGKWERLLADKPVKIITGNAPVWDGGDASPVLTVFWDYASPFCRNLWPHLVRLNQDGGQKVSIQMKLRPDRNNARSTQAALVALCAWLNASHELVHPLLLAEFAQPSATDSSAVDRPDGGHWNKDEALLNWKMFLSQIEPPDGPIFKCVSGPEAAALLSIHEEEGQAIGVPGVPTLFLNGRRIQVPSGIDFYSLSAALRQLP